MEIVFVRHGESTGNVNNKNNIKFDPKKVVLTSKGKKQAKTTGKFLKIFDKFDIIISSTMPRCIQTSNYIASELGYKKENILCDKRLIEAGNIYDELDGLTKEEFNKVVPKQLKDIKQKISLEKNPFKRLELQSKFRKLRNKKLKYNPTNIQAWNNYIKFLNWLKKQKYKRVLVVSHSYTMVVIMKILCNININDEITIIRSGKSKNDVENCSIMCVKKIKNKLELVSATEDQHLI